MTLSKSQGKNIKIVGIVVIIFVALVISLSAILIIRGVSIEEDCISYAQATTGEKWNTPVEMTDEERRVFPTFKSMSLGWREELKCEKAAKLYFLF